MNASYTKNPSNLPSWHLRNCCIETVMATIPKTNLDLYTVPRSE